MLLSQETAVETEAGIIRENPPPPPGRSVSASPYMVMSGRIATLQPVTGQTVGGGEGGCRAQPGQHTQYVTLYGHAALLGRAALPSPSPHTHTVLYSPIKLQPGPVFEHCLLTHKRSITPSS